MKEQNTPLVEEHLESLKGMQTADAGDFFYTRLRSGMIAKDGKISLNKLWKFPLKPVWTLSLLILLLVINGFMLDQQYRSKHISSNRSSIQNFAEAYDQTVNSSY